MNKKLTFILSLTFLFLFSGIAFADDLQDVINAYKRHDDETAKEKLLPLAQKGNAVAQYFLGKIYQPTKARAWLAKSAKQGYAKAMVLLAWHHQMDNCEEALKWIHFAVKKGSVDAYDEFRVWHMHGTCVPENHKEAIRLYHLAAEGGINNAQGNLGRLYLYGNGVPQDYVIAHMWFNVANANRTDSRELFPNMYAELRRKVEQLMTPAQIAEAQKLAREWMDKNKSGGKGREWN